MKLLILSLAVLLGIWSTEAYQCYRCDSVNQPGCNDPFSKNQIGDDYKIMAKPYERCQKTKILGGLISRSPVNASECAQGDDKCITVDVPFLGKSTTCCCNSDLCNGVSSIQEQSFFLFTIISILTILVYRWF